MTIPERLANRDIDPSAVVRASDLPERARVVIVGGGIIGSSIAYHLTREGETDVVVLERGRLTNGTTWHAAGLVSQVRGTPALTAHIDCLFMMDSADPSPVAEATLRADWRAHG